MAENQISNLLDELQNEEAYMRNDAIKKIIKGKIYDEHVIVALKNIIENDSYMTVRNFARAALDIFGIEHSVAEESVVEVHEADVGAKSLTANDIDSDVARVALALHTPIQEVAKSNNQNISSTSTYKYLTCSHFFVSIFFVSFLTMIIIYGGIYVRFGDHEGGPILGALVYGIPTGIILGLILPFILEFLYQIKQPDNNDKNN